MNFKNYLNKKNAGLVSVIVGSAVLGLTAYPRAGIADSEPPTNVINKGANQQMLAQMQPIPFPDTRQNPVALLQPENAPVEIKLVNNTNTTMTYQVIGDTDERVLSGGQEAIARSVEIPVTVTFVRSDGGLVAVQPEVIAPGMIQLNLEEAYNLDNDVTAMRIDETGEVYLY